MLAATHNSPQPLAESGHTFPTRVAPFIRYALSFSPYIYWSLPFTIPHSISIAAAPVTMGVAKDVPVTVFSLFPGININSRCCYVRFCIQHKAAFYINSPARKCGRTPRSTPIGTNTYCPPRSPRYCKCVLRRWP